MSVRSVVWAVWLLQLAWAVDIPVSMWGMYQSDGYHNSAHLMYRTGYVNPSWDCDRNYVVIDLSNFRETAFRCMLLFSHNLHFPADPSGCDLRLVSVDRRVEDVTRSYLGGSEGQAIWRALADNSPAMAVSPGAVDVPFAVTVTDDGIAALNAARGRKTIWGGSFGTCAACRAFILSSPAGPQGGRVNLTCEILTASESSSVSASPTASSSATSSRTWSTSASASSSATPSRSSSTSATMSASPTATASTSLTASVSTTSSGSRTPSPSATTSRSPDPSSSATPSLSTTSSSSTTASPTATASPSPTATASHTTPASPTSSASASTSASGAPGSETLSLTASVSASRTLVATATPSPSTPPAEAFPPPRPTPSPGPSLSPGAVAGLVLGAVAVAGLVGGFAWRARKAFHRRRNYETIRDTFLTQ